MINESQEETNKKYFYMSIQINIWMYFLAFFTLLFGNLMPVIIFGIGGAAFIFMGMSDKIRKYDWQDSQMHYKNCIYNGNFKGYCFNI
jgi:hypothetical protein